MHILYQFYIFICDLECFYSSYTYFFHFINLSTTYIHIFFFFLGCDSCVGQNVRHECADAGDCKDNICYCDVGFTGKGCQIGRK